VVGLAISTAWPSVNSPGLVWVTQAAARRMATRANPLQYTLNLKLRDPAAASAFANAHSPATGELVLSSWQQISQHDSIGVQIEQTALIVGSSLLGLLAVASVAVLVGGRMAEQTRRVGLLKAVGGTPRLVAAVLLAEHLALALAAAAAGLAVGWLVAPLLTSPAIGLLGAPGTPSLGLSVVGPVIAVALAVALLATFVPALRAARTSTVSALADAARPPRRGRRGAAAAARPVADRDLPPTARGAADRLADSGPPPPARRARRGQRGHHRGHGRGGADDAARRRHPPGAGRTGQPGDR
jgi:putative ABC transport system permease protein